MTLTSNEAVPNGNTMNAIDNSSPRRPAAPGPTIYEKIATGMRSKATREEVKFTLKGPDTAAMAAKVSSNKPDARNGNNTMKNNGCPSALSSTGPKIRMDTRALQKMAANRVLPSGHEVWAKRPSRGEEGPTQWESAITRQTA